MLIQAASCSDTSDSAIVLAVAESGQVVRIRRVLSAIAERYLKHQRVAIVVFAPILYGKLYDLTFG